MNLTKRDTKIQQIKQWLGTGSINIFGRPFAGKDTHCRELAELFDGAILGGGDILRSRDAPIHIQDHIAKGALAPTEEFLQIILPYFSRPEFKERPLILSSVGRWHGEEAAVLEATAASGHNLKVVILLDITTDQVERRWEQSQHLQDRGSRRDDARHILTTRLNEFKTKTMPVINFYKDQGMLIEIDGMPPRKKVLENILDRLAERAI